MKIYEIKKQHDQQLHKPKKEKFFCLKSTKSNSREDDANMAYINWDSNEWCGIMVFIQGRAMQTILLEKIIIVINVENLDILSKSAST